MVADYKPGLLARIRFWWEFKVAVHCRRAMREWALEKLGIADELATHSEEIGGLSEEIHQLHLWQAEQTRLAVDVSPMGLDPHQVIVVSRLGGGRVNIIPVHFRDLGELMDFVRFLKERYGVQDRTTWDAGPLPSFRDLDI